ncbi:MAG: SGNH/GDSL hydrolase family protein [Elusimicrobiota bacterium]|jgi:lysophospholipase L1-like esterase
MRIAAAAAAMGIALVLAEAGLRLARYRESPLTIKEGRAAARNDWRGHHAFKDKRFTADPVLIWKPKPSEGVFNSAGFRGRELAVEKRAGEVLVFAVGDSNTLGWDEVDGPNWPSYLEEFLRGDIPGVVVENAGVIGYSSFQGLGRLAEALGFSPDMVLISFGANDAHLVAVADADFAEHRQADLSRLRLLRLVAALRNRARGKGNLVHRVGLDRYKRNLREMVSLARQARAVPVLLTRPFVGGRGDDPLWWMYHADAYVEATREVAREAGTPLIDLHVPFKDRADLFADESHFNEQGHRLAARLIHRDISRLLVDRR